MEDQESQDSAAIAPTERPAGIRRLSASKSSPMLRRVDRSGENGHVHWPTAGAEGDKPRREPLSPLFIPPRVHAKAEHRRWPSIDSHTVFSSPARIHHESPDELSAEGRESDGQADGEADASHRQFVKHRPNSATFPRDRRSPSSQLFSLTPRRTSSGQSGGAAAGNTTASGQPSPPRARTQRSRTVSLAEGYASLDTAPFSRSESRLGQNAQALAGGSGASSQHKRPRSRARTISAAQSFSSVLQSQGKRSGSFAGSAKGSSSRFRAGSASLPISWDGSQRGVLASSAVIANSRDAKPTQENSNARSKHKKAHRRPDQPLGFEQVVAAMAGQTAAGEWMATTELRKQI